MGATLKINFEWRKTTPKRLLFEISGNLDGFDLAAAEIAIGHIRTIFEQLSAPYRGDDGEQGEQCSH